MNENKVPSYDEFLNEGVMTIWLGVTLALATAAIVPALANIFKSSIDDIVVSYRDKKNREKREKEWADNLRKQNERILPIIEKFQDDETLASMYKALPAYSHKENTKKAIQGNKDRKKGLTKIGNYIKKSLTPDELYDFSAISKSLRDSSQK